MRRFFVDTGDDGVEFVDTEKEARERAAECLEQQRTAARIEGEWRDEVDSICWGEIRETAKEVSAGEDGEYTDYQLRPVK